MKNMKLQTLNNILKLNFQKPYILTFLSIILKTGPGRLV